ncbi:MAG: PilZ domain-containing protein [Candidatus Omnitrophica bacterium]|nr:PilZ domain-containing protein [Candidatus Omnitrophota bacterium]
MGNEERRSLVRWKLDCQARIRLKHYNSIKNYECVINDINFKGLQATFKKKLPDNKTFKFTIVLENKIFLNVKAQVESCVILPDARIKYNFYFLSMKEEDKDSFYQFISKNYSLLLKNLWWKDVK